MSQEGTAVFMRCCRLCLSENKEPYEDVEERVVLKERIYAVLSIDVSIINCLLYFQHETKLRSPWNGF